MKIIKTVAYTCAKTCIYVDFLEGGFTSQRGDFSKLSFVESRAILEAVEAGGAVAKGAISTQQVV